MIIFFDVIAVFFYSLPFCTKHGTDNKFFKMSDRSTFYYKKIAIHPK